MSSSYIGGDPLPRPDISERGERGTPIRSKVKVKPKTTVKSDPPTLSLPRVPQPPTPQPPARYRAPENYSQYGQPGVNQMGPSGTQWWKPRAQTAAPAKTVSLGKLPAAPAKRTTRKSATKSTKKPTQLDKRVYSAGPNDPMMQAAIWNQSASLDSSTPAKAKATPTPKTTPRATVTPSPTKKTSKKAEPYPNAVADYNSGKIDTEEVRREIAENVKVRVQNKHAYEVNNP